MKLQEAEAQGDRLEGPDVLIENCGSVVMFQPMTKATAIPIPDKTGMSDLKPLDGSDGARARSNYRFSSQTLDPTEAVRFEITAL